MDKQEGLYTKAHAKLIELLPALKGETLSREELWRLTGIIPTKPEHQPHKKALNDVLWNLSEVNKKKLIKKVGNKFKVVDDSLVLLDWKKADPSNIYPLILPFGIHQYCVMYRKNIMIIFGSKDAGKTALMLNIIKLNMNQFRTLYFNSEMGEAELNNRISKFEGMKPEDWNFESYERSHDFEDAIDPDGLNLIDFLELGGDDAEYYKVPAYIRRIYDGLNLGVAVIALQMNTGSKKYPVRFPKGGEGALEKARVAIKLDPGKVTLAVAKNWAPGITENPRGKTWAYKLVNGVNIINPQETFDEF